MTDEEESNIQIQFGLPHNIRAIFNDQCTEFQVPPYSSLLSELIVSKGIEFEGDPLIDASDLKGLEGKATDEEAKWISNFIVDSYLPLVKSASVQNGHSTEVFGWEEFEKGAEKKTLK